METVNQEKNVVAENEEVKTFTQEEVNGIVNDRLARERKKYEGVDLDTLKAKAQKYDELEEANKSELEKANERANTLEAELNEIKRVQAIKDIRQKVATDMDIPVTLLTETTEEGCIAQAEAIKAYANPKYPEVRDGGEAHAVQSNDTRTQFADWANQAFN